jgi:hypothetical protein
MPQKGVIKEMTTTASGAEDVNPVSIASFSEHDVDLRAS